MIKHNKHKTVIFEDPNFFNTAPRRLITQKELDILLEDNTFYQNSKLRHGQILADYVTTHFTQNGDNYKIAKSAFFEHLERTDPELAYAIESVRAEIKFNWILQSQLNDRVLVDSSSSQNIGTSQSLVLDQQSFSKRMFSPAEPEFFDLGLIWSSSFKTDLINFYLYFHSLFYYMFTGIILLFYFYKLCKLNKYYFTSFRDFF